MNKLAKICGFAFAFALAACGGGGDDKTYDAALLEQYRAAIPKETQVAAKAPQASVQALVGDPALLPKGSKDIVFGINGSVGGIINTMKTIVATEPTIYKSDTKEFLWGPFPNDDGVGTVAAYIKDQGEGADFRYAYALLRGVDQDLAKMSPVIWGGANPDPTSDDHGSGVTLWDFEANYQFELANNPDVANTPLERGRFVAVYGKGKDAKGEFGIVLAALRKFVPKDKPMEAPADLDYFYGQFKDATNQVDFVNYEGDIDISNDPAKSAAEKLNVRLAFFNEGTGRGEATASGGDLNMGQVAEIAECWDKSIARSYLNFSSSTNGTPDGPGATEGDIASCGYFQGTLADLGVPSLAGVDPALKAALDNVATNGIPK
jgi:hypothetical protein